MALEPRRDHPTLYGAAVPRRGWVAAVAALVAMAVAVSVAGGIGPGSWPAAAQEQPIGSTTTTAPGSADSTTTTTAPAGEESTTTTAPPPPPPDQQPADDDGAPESVPQDQVVVPPPATDQPADPSAPILQEVAQLTLADIQKTFRLAQKQRDEAAGQLTALSSDVALLEQRLAQLQAEKAQAAARLQRARAQLRRRAVAGYMSSPASPINQMLDTTNFNDLSRRFKLFQAVIEADRNRIDEYNEARMAAGSQLEEVVTALDTKRAAQLVASTTLDGYDAALLAKQIQLSAIQAGQFVGGGFVFPVGGPHSFSDTFGAPRMFGTAYAHLHQGTDIFAAHGTPLLACERGVLIKIGTDTLGGTKLWLVGASGTRYYYAHLSGYAPDVVENKVVNAGDVIGYVGNTGNAATTPAHLHFEVHPNGGAAVNPYPLLRIVDEAQARYRAGASAPAQSNRGGSS